jgi:ppGpp synthetase/RelA/SpoT-type nucleotidyltranferase
VPTKGVEIRFILQQEGNETPFPPSVYYRDSAIQFNMSALSMTDEKNKKIPYPDTGKYDEAEEAVRRNLAEEMSEYAEFGERFDPKGDYMCKDCSQMVLPKSCGTVSGPISDDAGSCRYWLKDIPLVQLELKYTPEEASYTERPNWKEFGCKKCLFGAEAISPDSEGRPSWCSWWGIHVLPNACCAKNEGDDDFQPQEKRAAMSPAAKRINFQGIPIQIEWPRGSTRHGVNPDGSEWSNLMYADYGYIIPNNKRKVPVIEEFLKHYEREEDYYVEAAEIAKMKLEEALQAVGIRAMVSSRAKAPKRLRKKLYRRMPQKNYKTFRDIYSDIVDLAGVRVSLYLPADRDTVGTIIGQLFEETRPVKKFPEDKGTTDSIGYIANHYLIRLRPESLDGSDRRYAETKIEVQVASVLMHAWAEVTHDLIYKPEKGNLNPDEKLLLSQLNEIVRGGEVALERLQEKIENRTDEDLRFEIIGSCVKKASTIVTAAGWATDNENPDVYVGRDYESPYVYAVEQLKPNGEFDEYKFMLGFSTLEDARSTYLKHFQDDAHHREIEGIYEIPLEEFRTMLEQHAK